MFDFQVETPILNSPFREPKRHWRIEEGTPARIVESRRPPVYFHRPANADAFKEGMDEAVGQEIELIWVRRIRERLADWLAQGTPGASKLTQELLAYWLR